MKNVNLSAIQQHVNTQYGDLAGLVQLDGKEGISSIYSLCQENGIDTEGIFILGFGIGEHTINGVGQYSGLDCRILYLNKSEYGTNYDEIANKIKGLITLNVLQKRFEISYSDFGKYIKRYEILAVSEITNLVSSINIQEEN